MLNSTCVKDRPMLKIGKASNGLFEMNLDMAVETNSILGQRGSGKTYNAQVMAEEMLDAGVQVVVLDPLDSWFGLRSSADGKQAGKNIAVLGGFKGDLPLESTSGKILADFVVDNRASIIFSLRHLSKTKQLQFVSEFCAQLYHRKGSPEHRSPLHIFIDEADAFAPQRVYPESAKSLGAIDDLVRRGRSSGIGVTLITQRAAAISKDVLSQTETLICLKTTGPQDRAALRSWIEAHDTGGREKTFMDSLASLSVGEAWFWSPGRDIFNRVKIRRKTTFDSSSTPKAGERKVEAKVSFAVDIEKLKTAIATTVEQAQANDPATLRTQIRALQQQVKTLQAALEKPAVKALDPKEMAIHIRAELTADMMKAIEEWRSKPLKLITTPAKPPVAPLPPREPWKPLPLDNIHEPSGPLADQYRSLGKCERAIMNVLSFYRHGISKETVAVKAVYSVGSGGFNNALGKLRGLALIEGDSHALKSKMDFWKQPQSPLPCDGDLIAAWSQGLGLCERKILEKLFELSISGDFPTKETLGELTDYSASSGGFNNALGHLRSLCLIERGSPIRLTKHLDSVQ